MSLDYEIYPLKKLNEGASVFSGFAFKSNDFSDEGIPIVKIKNIQNKSVDLKEVQYFPLDKVNNKHKKFFLKNNDVLIAMTGQGSLGRVGRINLESNEYVLLNQRVGKFVVDEKNLHLNYLYHVISSDMYEKILFDRGTGSGQPNLSPEIILGTEIPMPNLTIQKKISSILDNINSKITLNKKINKNLFNIIDFIFKDYVGDYEDLEIVSLSENTQEIIRGFNSKYVEKSNIKNFNQKVNKGTFLEKQHFKYLDENIEIPKAKFAKKRDVLVNSLGDGTVGRPHYYNEDTDNVVVDQHITIIRANEDLIPSTYIYEYLKNSTGQYHLDSLISGSTGMLMLNISEIRNLKIPILDKKNLREFDTTVTPLFDKITKNFEEIYCLSKLRDTLLPKLMSGEIDVSKINCDLKIIIRKIYIKSSKLFLWRYLSENKNYIKNTKSNETLLKSRTIYKINKFLAKFNARYRYYRQ